MIAQSNPMRLQNYIAFGVFTGLLAIVLFVAHYVQSSKHEAISTQIDSVAQRTLFFRDLADGSVGVIAADSGVLIAKVEGEAGFVRGILRAMARDRRIRQIKSDDPFELLQRADGRLTLIDRATNNRIDLESFGKDNAAEFLAFLKAAR